MKKGFVVMMAIMAIVSAPCVFAEDLAGIVKMAESKYAGYKNNVKDITMFQETTMITENGNIPVQMKMLVKEPKFRAETKMAMPQGGKDAQNIPAMETTIIYDGKDIWMISPLMGKSKLPSGKEKEYQNKSNWWAMISDKAEVTGTEKIGDKTCYVIEAKEKGTNPFNKVWVDKDGFFMVKAESRDQGGKVMTLAFSDFKDTNGWPTPYKTDMSFDGKLVSTSIVKSIDINKNLADDLFDPAKIQAKEFNMQDYINQSQQQKQ